MLHFERHDFENIVEVRGDYGTESSHERPLVLLRHSDGSSNLLPLLPLTSTR